ncbi:MAG TPA: hypothetical protein VFL91_01325 [Thermomicrobiales bacterium]|nr:hypothetical protein [Thermomicrobiales bacterium]
MAHSAAFLHEAFPMLPSRPEVGRIRYPTGCGLAAAARRPHPTLTAHEPLATAHRLPSFLLTVSRPRGPTL